MAISVLLTLGTAEQVSSGTAEFYDDSGFPRMEAAIYQNSPFPGTTMVRTWSLSPDRSKVDNACVFLVASTPEKIKTRGVAKEEILEMSCYEPKW